MSETFHQIMSENYPWPGRPEGSGEYGTKYSIREVTLGPWVELDKTDFMEAVSAEPVVTRVEQFKNIYYEEPK